MRKIFLDVSYVNGDIIKRGGYTITSQSQSDEIYSALKKRADEIESLNDIVENKTELQSNLAYLTIFEMEGDSKTLKNFNGIVPEDNVYYRKRICWNDEELSQEEFLNKWYLKKDNQFNFKDEIFTMFNTDCIFPLEMYNYLFTNCEDNDFNGYYSKSSKESPILVNEIKDLLTLLRFNKTQIKNILDCLYISDHYLDDFSINLQDYIINKNRMKNYTTLLKHN
jgi:hypothetical protein